MQFEDDSSYTFLAFSFASQLCLWWHSLDLSRNYIVDIAIWCFYLEPLCIPYCIFVSVVATLKNATDVAKLNGKLFCGSKVDVRILPSNKLLCIAQLPLRMGERGFVELVKNYGEIERCFLMLTKNGIIMLILHEPFTAETECSY